MKRSLLYLAILFLTGNIPVFAQPEIKIVYTEKPPVIDGHVTDEAWKTAAVISDFSQKEPRNGEPVTERTEFLFMYDKANIYVGVRCYDNPGLITAKELARDVSLGEDDRIQVIFDTFLDGRNGYWFQIGPRGSIGDALVGENGKDFNKSWDGIWDGRAKITDQGWEAEMIIPFKTLSFKKGQGTWGLKCIRHIKRKMESAYWPATSLNADKFSIADGGRMTGIGDITQGIGLDIVTYATGGASKKENNDPDAVFDGGFDAFYQITPSMKAAVTVNTDFAQTEVDEKQINLTRFNLFFPEKRDFFLDGAGYFNFGINGDRENTHATTMIPYFSRRIGLDSVGNPIPVIYGGKFTGKAGAWNIGVVHIKDDNYWDNPGYSVARVSRNLGKLSSIGVIGTNGNALSSLDNSLAGIDLHLASSELKGKKNIVLNLYGAKSFTEGKKGKDYTAGAEINYPNDFFNFRAGFISIGENFTPGLGFVPRKGINNLYGSFRFGPRPKNSVFLQLKSGMSLNNVNKINTGNTESRDIQLDLLELDFLSGDIITFASLNQYESLDKEFAIFNGHKVPAGDYTFWRHSVLFTSAKRRNLWVSAKVTTGSFYSGRRNDYLLQAGYKIGVPVFLGAEADYRAVSLADGDFNAMIYRLNLNFLFNPRISWYNFAQYENQTERIGWQSRFQWIIKPGKEIFLTWNSPFIDPMDRFRAEVYEARIKVKYTIRF
ncbi:MAG: DUF5916 domain-containing protein [Bacteroidales bacterium]